MEKNLRELEQKIGYQFRDFELLKRSMRHSSYANEKHMKKTECNERLEFLGDAVLELASSEFLFFEDQNMPEGELTKMCIRDRFSLASVFDVVSDDYRIVVGTL